MVLARLPLLAAALALAGCAGVENRGLDSPHQPVVTSRGAFVPGCPDWHDSAANANDAMAANFGCATNANLAAMIADPADLLHGRASRGSDAFSAVKGVKAWRELVPTGKAELEKTGTKGGTP